MVHSSGKYFRIPKVLVAFANSLMHSKRIGAVRLERLTTSLFLDVVYILRKPRCAYILESEKHNLDFIVMPNGEEQVARDALLRANHAAGRNVMDAPEEDMHKIWDDMRIV